MGRQPSLAHRFFDRFEPVHAVTYFAPEARTALDGLGFRGFWMGYFAASSQPRACVSAHRHAVFSGHFAHARGTLRDVIVKSIALFVLAALLEIGGAWLVWQGVRDHRGWLWAGAGVIALGAYGFVAAFQPDAHFGRVLAAYGGVFIAGSLAWGMIADGFRPDRWDVAGAVVSLIGVGLIMYGPR